MFREYSLTHKGIAKVLATLKINSIVANSINDLKIAFGNLAMNQRLALITDLGILHEGRFMGHCVSIFAERMPNGLHVYVNDSQAHGEGFKPGIRAQIFDKQTVHFAYTSKMRQKPQTITCAAFAIDDCIAFHKNPHILQQLHKLNPVNTQALEKTAHGTYRRFEVFPDCMMSVANGDPEKEREKYESLVLQGP